jgi:hypothetical protein
VKNAPNPTAATSARRIEVRCARPFASSPVLTSREARTTPTIVTARPTACSALGRSPVMTPTTTGSVAPLAEIGATTLIVPTARAR